MRPRLQTVALAAIGIADLISTLFFIGAANAAEANPLMARILHFGPAAFVQAKLLLLLVPLVILELARRKHPAFVARAVNAGIVAYVGLYTVGVAHINRPPDPRSLVIPASRQDDIARLRELRGLPPRPRMKLLDRAERQAAQGAGNLPTVYSPKVSSRAIANAPGARPARLAASKSLKTSKAVSIPESESDLRITGVPDCQPGTAPPIRIALPATPL